MSITFNGSPIDLQGTHLNVGDKMPEFTLVANDLSPIASADLKGNSVFLTVPSLDTPVCDLEVRTFNAKAAELSGVNVYAVSMDLPFAQARWCGANGIESVQTLSDYKDRSFAQATGTYIGALGLLTRAVFVVNSEGTIVYAEYVPEVTNQPDYDKAYEALKNLA